MKFGLTLLPAYQLLEKFISQEISPSEVIKQLYHKIHQFNPQLKAFITLSEKQALDDAKAHDNLYQHKEIVYPLQGIPISIKDTFSTANTRTTAGYSKLRDFIPRDDAVLVNSIKKAGMISLGKTNTPSLGMDVQTFNDIFGRTNNPWNINLTPGGSSGGGAVSVATGMAPLALGSDLTGSIRIPAHFCGIYGFKPTENRISLYGHIPPLPNSDFRFHYLLTPGWLSRSVFDLQLAFNSSLTVHSADGLINYIPFRKKKLPSLKSIKIAILSEDKKVIVADEIKQLSLFFLQKLNENGVQIIKDQIPDFDLHQAGKLHAKIVNSMFPTKNYHNTLEEHFQFINQKSEYRKKIEHFLIQYDALLAPVTSILAFPHNIDHKPFNINGQQINYWRALIHYCRPFSLTGNPVIVIPIGVTSKTNLPVGIQLIGKVGRDEELLALAQSIENILPPLTHPPNFTSL